MKLTDIGFFLSGALDADGGSQSDPALSLGKYRSSTEIFNEKTASMPLSITGVTINYASSSNADGYGVLEFLASSSQLRWISPGSSPGIEVAVLADGTYLVYDVEVDKFIEVVVDFSELPTGDQQDAILVSSGAGFLNSLFKSYSSSEVLDSAVSADYRAIYIKNKHASEFLLYPGVFIFRNTESPYDAISLGIEGPSAQPDGYIQLIADEEQAPAGIVFGEFAYEYPLLLPIELPPGGIYGIWVKRTLLPGSEGISSNMFGLGLSGYVGTLSSV